MRVYTSRYGNGPGVVASGAIPVRMSVGFPAWPLGFTVVEQLMEVAPDPSMLGLDDEERFERLYRAKLDRVGVATIRKRLRVICDHQGHEVVALLCFENVSDGTMCHRRIFARWWEEETGEIVEELADPRRTPNLQMELPWGGLHGTP